MEKRRIKKQLVKSSTLGAGVVVLAALLAMVNYLGGKYYKRFDWTEARLYTLSEKTRNVLAGLEQDVEVVILMGATEPEYEATRELLDRYAAESPRIKVRVVDPDRNIAQASQVAESYGVERRGIIFASGKDKRVVDTADLADYDYSGYQFRAEPTMTAFKGEQQFTSALLELSEERKPKIVLTTGHGEAKLDDFGPAGLSQAEDLLGRDNFEFEEWPSLGSPRVPEGADLVVVAGPTVSFVPPEVEALSSYVENGGRVLLLLDPPLQEDSLVDLGLSDWLAAYGVELDDSIVVDPGNAVPFFGAETIFVNSYGSHEVTRPLDQADYPVILSLARSVRGADEVDGYEVTELLRTSADGWGETDLGNLRAVAKDDDDLGGPVAVGVAVEGDADGTGEEPAAVEQEGEEQGGEEGGEESGTESQEAAAAQGADLDGVPARLVVLGDSDFARNSQINNAGNGVLLANVLNWLVEREELVGIPAKEPEQVRLNLSRGQVYRISALVLGVLPGLAVLAGVSMYFLRRR